MNWVCYENGFNRHVQTAYKCFEKVLVSMGSKFSEKLPKSRLNFNWTTCD